MLIKTGVLARGAAGKSMLFGGLPKITADFLASGLLLDKDSASKIADDFRKFAVVNEQLRKHGLKPTRVPEEISFRLYEGDDPRCVFETREVVGQILTATSESSSEMTRLAAEYLDYLGQSDVYWAMIPCPPANPTGYDRERFERDLKLTSGWLRFALRNRPQRRPVAVAILISKIDARYESEEAARRALTDDVVTKWLSTMVKSALQSPQVVDAAVIPVSGMGFQNAVLKEIEADEALPEELGELDDEGILEATEPVYILKPKHMIQPYNLTTLVVWSLLMGLVNREIEEGDQYECMGQVVRKLDDDLRDLGGWYIPIKGRLLTS
jgi:hypothetical protein